MAITSQEAWPYIAAAFGLDTEGVTNCIIKLSPDDVVVVEVEKHPDFEPDKLVDMVRGEPNRFWEGAQYGFDMGRAPLWFRPVVESAMQAHAEINKMTQEALQRWQ